MNPRSPLLGVLLSLVVGCSSSSADSAPATPAVQVGVVVVSAQAVPLESELPGRVQASRIAEIRARVPGIVLERAFQEGSEVAQGDLLYRIDPRHSRPLPTALAPRWPAPRRTPSRPAARPTATPGWSRPTPSATRKNDDAMAARAAADAEVSAAWAALSTARLNLGYATVTAPIAVTSGGRRSPKGRWSARGKRPRATIQQVDPVYVNLTQSIGDLQRLRSAFARGDVEGVPSGTPPTVTILREDGSAHPEPGTLLFTDITVDESTGSVSLRAEVPNPERSLLPGEFVRARLPQAVVADGITVPQQAVRRTAQGANVVVVDAEQNAEVRPVVVGQAVGDRWLVTEGLHEGDQVVVDGLQKVRPGAPLAPVPWE